MSMLDHDDLFAPWWQFWDPTSGFRGGLLMGAVILAITFVACWVMGW